MYIREVWIRISGPGDAVLCVFKTFLFQSLSHVWLFCDPMDCILWPWDSPGKNTGVGSPSLLHVIFLTKGSNPSLLHWQADSLLLRHLGSPPNLEIYFKNSCEVCFLFPMYPCLFGIKEIIFSKSSNKQILWAHVAQVQSADQQHQHHLELVINAEFQRFNTFP